MLRTTSILWRYEHLGVLGTRKEHPFSSFKDETVTRYGINEESKNYHGNFKETADITHQINNVEDSSFMLHTILAEEYVHLVEHLLIHLIELLVLKLGSHMVKLTGKRILAQVNKTIFCLKCMPFKEYRPVMINAVTATRHLILINQNLNYVRWQLMMLFEVHLLLNCPKLKCQASHKILYFIFFGTI